MINGAGSADTATVWGKRNGLQVIIDLVGSGDILSLIAAEAVAQQGHDIVMYCEPLAHYEDQVIDHGEIYQEAERHYGKAHDFAVNYTYNARIGKYYGFCNVYGPNLINYRRDLWQAVGRLPTSWEEVHLGGRHIKLLHERRVQPIEFATENSAIGRTADYTIQRLNGLSSTHCGSS